jgi:hypothetical protein
VLEDKNAGDTARRPTPLPADKSMLPGRITSSIPMASVAVIDSSVVSSERLRALRNCGDTMAKNAQITNERDHQRKIAK